MSLASVQKITEIKDIEGADRIQAAKVLGYWTVIIKGEFKVGDLCVWHNPDTIVDTTNPVYSFLKDGRLKVIKLRKQVSQGLALPVHKFPAVYEKCVGPVSDYAHGIVDSAIGLDVDELINIKKYEKPIPECMKGEVEGSFPSVIPRTDENNLRSNPDILARLFAEPEVYVTIKVDGQSSTYYYLYEGQKFGVCSRNLELKPSENGFWKNAKRYNIEAALADYCSLKECSYALQGESYGPGIQANKLGVKELDFAAYSLYNITKAELASLEEFSAFCDTYQIPSVISYMKFEYGAGNLKSWGSNIDELVAFTNELKYENGSPAEGIVIRATRAIPLAELRELSGKIINENFSLKHGE